MIVTPVSLDVLVQNSSMRHQRDVRTRRWTENCIHHSSWHQHCLEVTADGCHIGILAALKRVLDNFLDYYPPDKRDILIHKRFVQKRTVGSENSGLCELHFHLASDQDAMTVTYMAHFAVIRAMDIYWCLRLSFWLIIKIPYSAYFSGEGLTFTSS